MPAPKQEETKEMVKIDKIKTKDFEKKLMETLGRQLTIFFVTTRVYTGVFYLKLNLNQGIFKQDPRL